MVVIVITPLAIVIDTCTDHLRIVCVPSPEVLDTVWIHQEGSEEPVPSLGVSPLLAGPALETSWEHILEDHLCKVLSGESSKFIRLLGIRWMFMVKH